MIGPADREIFRNVVQTVSQVATTWNTRPTPFTPDVDVPTGVAFNPTPGVFAPTTRTDILKARTNAWLSARMSDDIMWEARDSIVGDNRVRTICELREYTVTIRVEAQGLDEAYEALDKIRVRIYRDWALTTLLAANISVIGTLSINDVPVKVDSRAVSAASMDLQVYYATGEVDPTTTGDYITSVETVNALDTTDTQE